MAIQYAGGTTVNTVLDTSVSLNSSVSQTAQSFNSAIYDFKTKLVNAGWSAVLKPAGVNISFSGLPTAGQTTTIDGVVYTYRSSFSSTTTLSASISNTTTATVSVTSGTNIVTGCVIKIDSEFLYVSGGGGTSELTVVRGYSGSTPATHSNGATVTIGCEVLRDATAAATATNLKDAIIANSGTIGTAFSNGTPAHHSVTAINPTSGWVNVYTKDVGLRTVNSFTTTNTGTNITVSGLSSGSTSLYGGWWLYPARTPAGLHGRINIADVGTAASSGTYGTLWADLSSADGSQSPYSLSSGLSISITTAGVYTTSGSNQGTSQTALTVGKEIIVNTTPPQVFTIASITSTTTGTVSVAPPKPINSVTYNLNGVRYLISVPVPSNIGKTANNGFGTPLKILANKHQLVCHQMFDYISTTPDINHLGFDFVLPWIPENNYPYKISSISASPSVGTRFVTVGSHGLSTGDSVYITEVKINNAYSYFCANTIFTVTVINDTTFDITSVDYPGGTYTYDSSNYAIMTPMYPQSKTKTIRAMYMRDGGVLNYNISSGGTSIRNPLNTSHIGTIGSVNPKEYSFIQDKSFYYDIPINASYGSLFFIAQYYTSPNEIGTNVVISNLDSSASFVDPQFGLWTVSNRNRNTSLPYFVGQYWDSFIGYKSAALDSQIVYNGRIWQNFVSGAAQNTNSGSAVAGSFWIAIN